MRSVDVAADGDDAGERASIEQAQELLALRRQGAAEREALEACASRVATPRSVSTPAAAYIEARRAVTSLHSRRREEQTAVARAPHPGRHIAEHHRLASTAVCSSDGASLKTAGFKSGPRQLRLGSSRWQRQSSE